MKIALPEHLPKYQIAQKICTILLAAGHETYFAGGCVRDLILGLIPTDFDIATDARPDHILEIFHRFPEYHTRKVGMHFGIVIIVHRNVHVEVASFRKDGPYIDGRHPDHVTFTNAKEDVQRRDFTINGLLQDPTTGEIIDYVHGIQDLQNGIIRTIGDPRQRFEEDYLRILRAIRFTARFNFTLDEQTFQALCLHASSLSQISRERIKEEWLKILNMSQVSLALSHVIRSGLFPVLFPFLTLDKYRLSDGSSSSYDALVEKAFQWVQTLERIHTRTQTGKHFEHHIQYKHQKKEIWLTPFALMLVPFYKEQSAIVSSLVEHEKYSNQEVRYLQNRLEEVLRTFYFKTLSLAQKMRLIRAPYYAESLIMTQAIVEVDPDGSDHIQAAVDLYGYYFCDAQRQQELFPKPWFDGTHLQKWGFKPGALFRRILDELEDGQLDGSISSKKEAEIWVQQRFGEWKNPDKKP